MDQKIILSILRFYRDIGIDLNISQFKENSEKEPSKKYKKNNKIRIQNTIVTEEKKADLLALKAKDVYELENLFKNYDGCNLKKTAANFVKFHINENSNLLFIDGTPDREEDKSGNSFISLKGNLFDKMLNAINLKKDDIFIVNAIPWRPPGNRVPTAEEIKICRPFIVNLIKLLKPKIIVCLGEVSTNQILDINESIIKIRGKWHFLKSNINNGFAKGYNPYVLPTLNISFLLTRPDMKRQAWEDMKLLRDKIKEI